MLLYPERYAKKRRRLSLTLRNAKSRCCGDLFSILQEDSEAEKDTAEECSEAEASVGHENRTGALVVVGAAGTGRCSTAEASDGDL
jgi:hypothetical protein